MNKNIAIKAENISKQYRLGEVGTGTITHDLNRFWAKMRGKEDPFLKIGESNDRSVKGSSDYVWSLKDINFEIEKGDAVGIIGRNGAGKSTLLKLFSRVTQPTTGYFDVQGRIASLLEVGTGFNPEMTGRENIFLNGAILGMRKAEIKKKFDEIVDFAGVERYIDTPVKRYSSGMYVRLAFAVAAHLESEILIVDEVLAVGDAEFQKKCLGKMGDVSKGEGRTVLFVSHNIAAVKTLCNNGIFLKNGQISYIGDIDESIKQYLSGNEELIYYIDNFDNFKIKGINFFNPIYFGVKFSDGKHISHYIPIDSDISFDLKFICEEYNSKLSFGINIYNQQGELLLFSTSFDETVNEIKSKVKLGLNHYNIHLPAHTLNEGVYFCELVSSIHKSDWLITPENNAPMIKFEIKGYDGESDLWNVKRPGVFGSILSYKIL